MSKKFEAEAVKAKMDLLSLKNVMIETEENNDMKMQALNAKHELSKNAEAELFNLNEQFIEVEKKLDIGMQELNKTHIEVVHLNKKQEEANKKHDTEMHQLKKKLDEEKTELHRNFDEQIKALEDENLKVKQLSSRKINELLRSFDN